MTRTPLYLVITLYFVSSLAAAKDVQFGAFLDGYYAYDKNRPDQRDRAYTTQPARHDEFNINLAFVDVEYKNPKGVAGRLALQVGTSVEANYSSEPIQGSFSNSDMVKFLQEAYLGTEIAEDTWIYGGIFFSHIGMESFISQDNLTYTRSLVADFSPFYQSGIKIHHDFTQRWSAELHVLNGWQTVTDSNGHKTLGMQISYAAPDSFSFSYNNLVGGESQWRHFHDFTFMAAIRSDWQIGLQADIGLQEKIVDGESVWHGASLISKVMLSEMTGFSQRLEYYSDQDQVIVSTNRPQGFDMISISLGIDRELQSGILWRSEIRHFQSTEKIIPEERSSQTDNNQLFVTSLSYRF